MTKEQLTKLVVVSRALGSRWGRDGLWCIWLDPVLGVGLDVLEERLDGSVSIVVKEDIAASWLELDRREALNAEPSGSGEIVLGSLEFGDPV